MDKSLPTRNTLNPQTRKFKLPVLGDRSHSSLRKYSSLGALRWILKILHDPNYLIPWESGIVWSSRLLSLNSRWCKMSSINSTLSGMYLPCLTPVTFWPHMVSLEGSLGFRVQVSGLKVWGSRLPGSRSLRPSRQRRFIKVPIA